MTEPIGRQYETAIPALSDTANIQEAFRIYHYGVPTSEFNPTNTEPTDLEPKSIAYYLNNFQEQINDIESLLSPTAYQKRGNMIVAGDDGPIVLELNPEYPDFSENGLVLTSYDGADTGMRWQLPEITISNIENMFNKTLGNTTIASDGLRFRDSTALHTTTVRAPTQALSKTVFLPTSEAVMPGTSTTLVGTDTTQTLTNKTLTSPSITSPTISGATLSTSSVQDGGAVVGTTATQTLTNKTLTSASVTSGGSVVGTTATQTLTNKTISLEPANNTITGILPVANGATPAGVISQYAGTSAPTGYLLCQGQSVSTTTFAALFAAIGYNYGGSGGSFNVPNLENRVPVGRGTGTFGSLNATGGAETVTLNATQMPVHTHIQDPHNHDQNSHGHSASSGSAGSHGHTASTNSAGSHTHGSSGSHTHLSYNGAPVTRAPGIGAENTQDRIISLASRQNTSSTDHTHDSDGSHSHTVTVNSGGSHSHTVTVDANTATNIAKTATNQNAGGLNGVTQAHNNLQPYIVVNYIIKT